MSGKKSGMVLKKNDRIVFFGDSITEQHLYTNYVETYLATRFPGLNLSFLNAGWGGNSAPEGAARLDRDVLALKPNVVTICFGMNDGYYCEMRDEILKFFSDAMNEIVKRLKAAKVRVVLLTPGMVDHSRKKELAEINYSGRNLRILADFVLSLAKREHLPVYDIHKLMTEVDAAAKKDSPDFTMIPDSVHPDPAGHLVMAYGLLKALRVPPLKTSAQTNLKTEKFIAGKDIKISGIRPLEMGFEFNVKLDHLPFFVQPDARKILKYVRFMEEYSDFRLVFRGVKGKRHYFKTGAFRSEMITSEELEKGINLSAIWNNPYSRKAELIYKLTNEKDQLFYRMWRELALNGKSGTDYNRMVHISGIRTSLFLEKIRNEIIDDPIKENSFKMLDCDLPGEPIDNNDFISCWSLRGPFKSEVKKDITDFIGCEETITSTIPHLSDEWKEGTLNIENPENSLNMFFGDSINTCCYLMTIIESPVDQEASLLLGSDDGFAVWLNGKCLESKLDLKRGLKVDQERFQVQLKKGPNPLMLKVSQGDGYWGVCARFAGLSKVVSAIRPNQYK
ncbi:MAG: SGNH/GDSL hydrolase family protein [Candidatus Margulisiibacteriota bacterium]